MEKSQFCDICGQELTGETGRWVLGMSYYGIMRRLPVRVCCCSECMSEVNRFVIGLAKWKGWKRDESAI